MTDERPPPLEPELVGEFVLKAHGDLGVVMQLLEEEPALVNAAWDWGGGDWETGLGAASHVGRRDIAEYLLERGARMDVFAAAMLGETEIVRAMLEAQPSLRDARGPHGIPLVAHAEAGGDAAREVLQLLQGAPAPKDAAPLRASDRLPAARVDLRTRLGRGLTRTGQTPAVRFQML